MYTVQCTASHESLCFVVFIFPAAATAVYFVTTWGDWRELCLKTDAQPQRVSDVRVVLCLLCQPHTKATKPN